MKNILFILAMLVSFIANAYEPMIREDRIWEFGKCLYLDNIKNIKKYRFEGTEIRNGKTYNVLKIEQDNGWEAVALMRENVEKQAIYVLLNQKEIRYPSLGRNGIIELNGDTEFLLHDVSIDSKGADIVLRGFVRDADREYYDDYELIQLNLVNLETLNFQNTSRKYFCYTGGDTYNENMSAIDMTTGLFFVEGVGNVGFGMPYYPAFVMFQASETSNDFPYRFLRLTDPWGNTVFDARWIFGGSDIESVNSESRPTDERKYNLQGVETDRPEPGSIYIQNGEKHVAN